MLGRNDVYRERRCWVWCRWKLGRAWSPRFASGCHAKQSLLKNTFQTLDNILDISTNTWSWCDSLYPSIGHFHDAGTGCFQACHDGSGKYEKEDP